MSEFAELEDDVPAGPQQTIEQDDLFASEDEDEAQEPAQQQVQEEPAAAPSQADMKARMVALAAKKKKQEVRLGPWGNGDTCLFLS